VTSTCRGAQHHLGAVDVDVVHPCLVADRVEQEGKVDERVGLGALEQVPGCREVTNVSPHEGGLGVGPCRWADVEVDDFLDLLARREDLGETRADVT
jgi:hypothetical protein